MYSLHVGLGTNQIAGLFAIRERRRLLRNRTPNGFPMKITRKANLKLVAGSSGTVSGPAHLRAGGLEPSDSMAPGEYVTNCEGAKITTKGSTTIAVLEFRVIDGPHSGTALRQWIPVPDVGGIVPLGSRYGRQCALALGRDVEPGDDLNPAAIFRGKTFRVQIGYRLTEKTGGIANDDNMHRRKDAKDFLRVHRLMAMEVL